MQFGTMLSSMRSLDGELTPASVEALARELYAIEGKAERLTGERDENFRIRDESGNSYVFKVSHPDENPAHVELMIEGMRHVAQQAPDVICPRTLPARNGKHSVVIDDAHGRSRIVRLVSWVDGVPIRTSPRSAAQRRACGIFSAHLARALSNFQHPAAKREIIWDIKNFPRSLELLDDMPGFEAAEFIRHFGGLYAAHVDARLPSLRSHVVHNDMNANNIMVDETTPDHISGIIDFGDMVETALVADIAIAAGAQITSPESAEQDVSEFLGAYHGILPIQAEELGILHWLIGARALMDALIPSWKRIHEPDCAHYAGVDQAYVARKLAIATAMQNAEFHSPE